jgi:cysteine synthase A
MAARAAQLAADAGAFYVDQFHNEDMIDGYSAIADELLAQLPTPELDAWVGYIGTAGCFLGVTRALRQRLPEVRRIAVEPAESPVLSGGEPGTHRIEGGGIGKWPPLLGQADFDEVLTVSEADAFAHTREAARTEGVFSGPSTGANLAAAVRVARRLGRGHRVATVQVDSGLKYLGGAVYSTF